MTQLHETFEPFEPCLINPPPNPGETLVLSFLLGQDTFSWIDCQGKGPKQVICLFLYSLNHEHLSSWDPLLKEGSREAPG